MMSDGDLTEQAPRRRAPRWMRLLLLVSLALNLLVVGSVVGMALRLGGPRGPDGPPPQSIGSLLYRELPREDRRELRSDSRRIIGQARPGERMSPDEELAEIDAGLRADPFDPSALDSVLNEHGMWLAAQHQGFQEAWLTHVADMTRAERAAYADRLQEAFERRKQRWHERRKQLEEKKAGKD